MLAAAPAEGVRGAGAHFDENQGPAAPGDEVDLAEPAAVVAGEDRQPARFQEPRGQRFGGSPRLTGLARDPDLALAELRGRQRARELMVGAQRQAAADPVERRDGLPESIS